MLYALKLLSNLAAFALLNCALSYLLPDGAMIAWTAAAIVGAAAIGAGGSASSAHNAQASGLRNEDIINSMANEWKASPLDFSSGLQSLLAQNAYGLGTSPEALSLELLVRQFQSASHPQQARKLQAKIQGLGATMLQLQGGGLDAKQQAKLQKIVDSNLAEINQLLTKAGVGSFSIEDGKPVIRFVDPALQQVVDKARLDSEMITNNRLTGQMNLSKLAADFPMATEADLAALEGQYRQQQEREINERYGLETDRILQQANARGYNPAGILGELEKQRTQDLFDTQFTSVDRALQVLGGRQDLATRSIAGTQLALSPDMTIAIQNAIRGQESPTTGQLAAAQLAASSNANQNNADNTGGAINNIGGQFSDAIMLLGLMNRRESNQNNPGPGASNDYSYSTDPLVKILMGK